LAFGATRRYDAAVILAGDVGGTKTHLALFTREAGARRPAFDQRYPSRDHASLEALVVSFLAEAGSPAVTRAAFGIAGVVVGNRCETTNLPWHVDGAIVAGVLGGAPVTLLNDLAVTAHGLDVLEPSDLETLQPGAPEPGVRAVLAAGTGLGMVAAVRGEGAVRAIASEGGHADFAARSADEAALLGWLRERYGRVSVERVLSGRGLADLYRFLGAIGRGAEPREFAARFAAAPDPAAVVSEGALQGQCERATLALAFFVSLYGAEAGNLALRTLPLEGLYLGGGIAPRVRPALRDGRFMQAFHDKAPMQSLMSRVPVHLILDDQTALWGAAHVALADA
jgi:glucokinase